MTPMAAPQLQRGLKRSLWLAEKYKTYLIKVSDNKRGLSGKMKY